MATGYIPFKPSPTLIPAQKPSIGGGGGANAKIVGPGGQNPNTQKPSIGGGGGASARLVGPGWENPNSGKQIPTTLNPNSGKQIPNTLFSASTPTRPTLIAGNPKPVMNLLTRSSAPLFGSLTKKL